MFNYSHTITQALLKQLQDASTNYIKKQRVQQQSFHAKY